MKFTKCQLHKKRPTEKSLATSKEHKFTIIPRTLAKPYKRSELDLWQVLFSKNLDRLYFYNVLFNSRCLQIFPVAKYFDQAKVIGIIYTETKEVVRIVKQFFWIGFKNVFHFQLVN